MSHPPHHKAETDPVTGYETTGHDWNGIRELNTPFPRIVIWALVLTFAYSVVAWVLLPAWPLGRDYTRGLLGLDQGDMAVKGYQRLAAVRADWLDPFADGDFAALADDAALMARATPATGLSAWAGRAFPILPTPRGFGVATPIPLPKPCAWASIAPIPIPV
jgi:cytochrome c oxidase cbb3-type subunit 3